MATRLSLVFLDWKCVECGAKNAPSRKACACGSKKPTAEQVVAAKLDKPRAPTRPERKRSSVVRLGQAVKSLIWNDKEQQQEPADATTSPRPRRIAVVEMRRGTVVSKASSLVDRMAKGQAARSRDVNNNTQSGVTALESLLEDKTGNSDVGANHLRKLVMPDFDVDEEDLAKTKKTSFDNVNDAVLQAARLPPEQRTAADLKLLNRHLGWHPFFNVARGRLKARLLRTVTAVSPKPYTVVVLQGDPADAAYVVYSGKLAVHIKTPDIEVRRNRFKYINGPVAKDAFDYHSTIEDKLGPRVAFVQQGNAFGEHGLEARARRNATVLSVENTHLFCIRRDAMVTKRDDKSDRLSSFEGAPHEPLVNVLRTPADERTDDDFEVVLHHCSWQPFFSVLEPGLSQVACRHVKLLEVPTSQCVVLQGDLADCYFIVYCGQAEVYVTKDGQGLNRWKGLNLWTADDDDDAGPVDLPVHKAGDKVFMLEEGMAFGESGLDPKGPTRRSASVFSAGRNDGRLPLMLLALYRDDVRSFTPEEDNDDDAASLAQYEDGDEYDYDAPRFSRRQRPVLLDKRPKKKKKKAARGKLTLARRLDSLLNG